MKALSQFISEGLVDNGFYVISPNQLDASIRTGLISDPLKCIKQAPLCDEYEGGRLRIYNQNEIATNNNSRPEYVRRYLDLCQALIAETKFRDLYHVATFETLDTPVSSHIAQAPHFDRIPSLKFMLYLNNISLRNGPFWLAPRSHVWVKQKYPLPRPSHQDLKFYKQTRRIPQSILLSLRPVPGQQGTIIVFDTDCVHCQGIPLNGDCHILRSHFRASNSLK